MKDGFFNQASLVHEGNIMDGAVRDVPEALSTLRDTREVSAICGHYPSI